MDNKLNSKNEELIIRGTKELLEKNLKKSKITRKNQRKSNWRTSIVDTRLKKQTGEKSVKIKKQN